MIVVIMGEGYEGEKRVGNREELKMIIGCLVWIVRWIEELLSKREEIVWWGKLSILLRMW